MNTFGVTKNLPYIVGAHVYSRPEKTDELIEIADTVHYYLEDETRDRTLLNQGEVYLGEIGATLAVRIPEHPIRNLFVTEATYSIFEETLNILTNPKNQNIYAVTDRNEPIVARWSSSQIAVNSVREAITETLFRRITQRGFSPLAHTLVAIEHDVCEEIYTKLCVDSTRLATSFFRMTQKVYEENPTNPFVVANPDAAQRLNFFVKISS